MCAGIQLGFSASDVNQNEVQFVSAYADSGGFRNTIKAVNQLIFFERADIVSGLISYKAVPEVMPLLEKHNKLGFFFDLGEHIPYFNNQSERLFYSSQQIWQTQYALGKWAQKEFGGSCMLVMPVYEAGYHLNSAFLQGVEEAGGTEAGLHVLPFSVKGVQKEDMDALFEQIKKNMPTYVHAIFTGSMGNEFLASWRKSEFYGKIPLTVVENMAYDDMLKDVAELDMEMYTAFTWSRTQENAKNKEFVKRFENTGQMANIFGLLGYEMGLALREVKPYLLKRDWDSVSKLLQTESINGPRGERNFYPQSGFALPAIDIVKVKTSSGKIYKTVLSQGNGLKFDADVFKSIHDGNISGWQNPYMCV